MPQAEETKYLHYNNAYLDIALTSNDAIYRRFCERIEGCVCTPHELGLEDVSTIAVVFVLALVKSD